MKTEIGNAMLRTFKNPGLWIVSICTIVPSLRPMAKYLPSSIFFIAVPVYCIAAVGASAAFFRGLRSEKIPGFFRSKFFFGAVLAIITCVNFAGYPLADNLKKDMRGSDQDDAIIQTGQTLLSGHNPYHAHLYTGFPISPGPGIILLSIPFAAYTRYFLLTPCALLIMGLLIARTAGSFLFASAFLALMGSSFAFWEIMIVGSDMIAIGLLFAMATLWLFSRQLRSHVPGNEPVKSALTVSSGIVEFFAVVIFSALVATSRILFIGLVPLWSLLLFKINKRSALVFFCCTTIVTVALHYIFYIQDPHAYTPFHVIGKGKGLMGPILGAAGAASTLAMGIVIFMRTRPTLPSWMMSLGLGCGVPLAFVALGDLITRNWAFAKWEGVNYLFVFVPIVYLHYIFDAATLKSAE